MQVVHDEVFIGGDLLPLEVVNIHLLAGAVVHTAEHIDVISEIECAVQESRVRHRTKLNEFHCLQIQHHGIFGSGTVVMASKNDNFVAGNEGCRLGLNRQRELDREDRPLVVGDIVLLDRVYATTAFVATKDINVGVFEYDGRHGAPPLVQVGDALPPIHVDGVSLATLKHPIDGPATNRVNKVALVGECVRVPALVQSGLLGANLILGVVHEHRASHICEA